MSEETTANEAGEGAALSAEDTGLRPADELLTDAEIERLHRVYREDAWKPDEWRRLNVRNAARLLLTLDATRAALTASERERDIALGQLGVRIRHCHDLMVERDAARAQLAAQQAENERLRAAVEEAEGG